MSPGPSTTPRAATVYAALLVSGAGHVIHNVAEFPLTILIGWETLVPLVVTSLLGIVLVSRPGRLSYGVAGLWTVIVILFGGGSVVPFAFLPFVPEQSLSHYAAHLVYAVSQLPLLWVAYRGVTSRQPPGDHTVLG